MKNHLKYKKLSIRNAMRNFYFKKWIRHPKQHNPNFLKVFYLECNEKQLEGASVTKRKCRKLSYNASILNQGLSQILDDYSELKFVKNTVLEILKSNYYFNVTCHILESKFILFYTICQWQKTLKLLSHTVRKYPIRFYF